MKALGITILLLTLLLSGVIVWAVGAGTPLSGEPVVELDIGGGAGQGAPHPVTETETETGAGAGAGAKTRIATPSGSVALNKGQTQVVMDVAHDDVVRRERAQGKSSPSKGAYPRPSGLFEPSKYGPLPKRAADGRTPGVSYARGETHAQDNAAQGGVTRRIAILLMGVGLNQSLSYQAIKTLPGEISLAFSSYGRELTPLVNSARLEGHELLLQVPLEPQGYPRTDTGPHTLLTGRAREENRPHLHWSLGRFPGYFAVVNARGERFFSNKPAVKDLFQELQQRGLRFFQVGAQQADSLSHLARETGLGYAHGHLELDKKPNRDDIDKALEKLEQIARRSGFAIGVAHMHPATLDRLRHWSRRLSKRGFKLVPVSAAYRQQGQDM